MSGDADVRDLYVVSEQLIAVPEPIAQPPAESDPELDLESDPEEESEEDSEEAPENSLVEELMERHVELEDKVHELEDLYQEEKDAATLYGALVQHLVVRNGELADRLREAGQKIERVEEEKEVMRDHLGLTIQGLETRIQNLQMDKQAVTNLWRGEMKNSVRSEKRNDELEVEVRSKKAKIDRVNHAFRTAHERFQHRVHHFPREEYRSGHAISRGLVMEMADEEHEDALRRSE